MKHFAIFLLCLSFVACKQDCEKDHTGTVRIINYHKDRITMTLDEDLFNPAQLILESGEIQKIEVKVNFYNENTGINYEDGYQVGARYTIEGDTSIYRTTIIPYQCELVDVYLTD